MTELEARRLCLLEMADALAQDAIACPLRWALSDVHGRPLDGDARWRVMQAAESLVQQWREEAAALTE